jgi:hypothetical protein
MLRIPATINSVRTLSDGGLKLDVVTQELAPEDEAVVMQLKRQLGHFVFAVTESIQAEDIPIGPVEFKDDLTLDERLNKVLFAYHMAKTNNGKTFHSFKREVYERMIELYKEKLGEIK